MAIGHAMATVGTAAVPLAVADANGAGQSLLMSNVGTVTVYLGGSAVSSSSYGYVLLPGATLSIELMPDDGGIYCVTASGSATLALLARGV